MSDSAQHSPQPPRIAAPWRHWDDARLRRNIGVYVHVPFCLHRCGYCDFLTFADKRPAGLDPANYVAALHEEIARRGEWAGREYGAQGRAVDTVFFGGGTPTYLKPEELAGLIQAVLREFPLVQNARGLAAPEITVEANPDTLTPEYLAALGEAGVNRLSVGIQATQPRHLRRLERTHRFDDIRPVLAALQRGPIRRYSFDLIYGLPDLQPAELRESLRRLLHYGPRHISAYELIYEPGTPLHRWRQRFPRQPLDERRALEQHALLQKVLRGYGLYRYEISNYAVPGEESRHNLRYWRGGDYIGLGLGAASRIGSEVLNNPRSFDHYRHNLKQSGTVADPLASALAALAEQAEHAGAVLSSKPQLTAPPADVFMQMRSRGGMALPGASLPPHWLTRGWVRPRSGMLEPTSRGLAFGDAYHKELS